MTSLPGHYDQNLLASAPEVTGERRREGYTTEILTSNTGKATPPLTAQSDVEAGLVTKEYHRQPPTRALPFWRTRKGMIIILVAGIIILGAIIGGAVGGTVGKKDPKGAIPGPSAPDGSDGNGFPGVKGGSPTTTSGTSSNSTTAPPGATTADTGIGSGPLPTSSVPSNPIPVAPAGGDGGKDGGQDGTEQTRSGGTSLDVSDSRLAGIVEHI
ncbi:hypothetical protein BDZ94DRAFT_1246651 [Collybia nuda]|uniref:Uncharacterized protein n=1 Tax=Collybia nuda TaxID=64659 RepID=A0A9P6CJ53_9AGAR|nr:hypothetical protein BDZ94DRAFT_1246651 [Collybia nuda]